GGWGAHLAARIGVANARLVHQRGPGLASVELRIPVPRPAPGHSGGAEGKLRSAGDRGGAVARGRRLRVVRPAGGRTPQRARDGARSYLAEGPRLAGPDRSGSGRRAIAL